MSDLKNDIKQLIIDALGLEDISVDDIGDELFLIVASVRNPTLCRAMLPEHTADPPLRHLQSEPDMVDAGAATRGAYQFPEAASFRISLSSARLAPTAPTSSP